MFRPLLCGCCVLALTSAVDAQVRRFDNRDGAFPWTYRLIPPDPQTPGQFLDITQPATQTGSPSARGIERFRYTVLQRGEVRTMDISCGSAAEIVFYQSACIKLISSILHQVFYLCRPYRYEPGQIVRPDALWYSSAHLGWSEGLGDGQQDDHYCGRQYAGASVLLADGQHVGWILLTGQGPPTSWAYELRPNTAIRIPQLYDCPADFNDSGQVNSQDFFDYLNAFFAADITADYDGDGQVGSPDALAFIQDFLTGC